MPLTGNVIALELGEDRLSKRACSRTSAISVPKHHIKMGEIAFPYNTPNANTTISPTLVRVFICRPRKTKMGNMTQMRSVATPKAVLVVSKV